MKMLSIFPVLALALVSVSNSAAAAGREVAVSVQQMRYGAIPSGLKVGDTIVWKNNDGVPHTVTARDKSFDLRLNPHQSVSMTLTKPGAFQFYCIYHVQMRGTLTVAR